MPLSKCPICGEIFHMSVADPQRWYAERYPGIPFGELVPAKCFYCWPDLDAGMRVVIRPALRGENQVAPGTTGVINRVLSATEDGSIFHVHLDCGQDRYFIRADLRKAHDAETEPVIVADGNPLATER